MKLRICGILAIALLLALPVEAQKKKDKAQPTKKGSHKEELIVNGALEQGSGRTPKGWAKFDGITQLWQTGGNPGKCLVLNTAVLQKDKKEFIADEEAFKNKKTKNQGGQYSVVGAHEGAWAYCAPIDVLPTDSWFILSCDVMAPGKSDEIMYPQILVRGYVPVKEVSDDDAAVWYHHYYGPDQGGYEDMFGSKDLIRKPRVGDWKMVYRFSMACRTAVPNKFRHYEVAFNISKMKRFRPSRLLIKPYAYWPAGIYRFDNISLRRCTAEEAKAVNDNRPSIHEVVQ